MTLKNAAFLAFVGTVLLTVFWAVAFIRDVSHVLRGLVPAIVIVASLIHTFASFTLAVFFYFFHRAQ